MRNKFLFTFHFILLISLHSFAFAELPEPLDPKAQENMSFEERRAQGLRIREALQKASPEERKIYREKVHEKLQALSPEERREFHQKMKAQW